MLRELCCRMSGGADVMKEDTEMEISGKTRTCGLIGCPVEHTLSPVIHNTLAAQMGHDLVYVPFPVQPGRLREAVPGIGLTTDIIVGFPGETEEDFEETMDVVRQVRFDSAFTFIYSKRTGTPAAAMEDQVPEEIVKPRFERLLKEVQRISAEVCGKDVGKTMTALVEGMDIHDPALVTGRLSNNIMVHFPGDASDIGKLIPVLLTESKGFYYMGKRLP